MKYVYAFLILMVPAFLIAQEQSEGQVADTPAAVADATGGEKGKGGASNGKMKEDFKKLSESAQKEVTTYRQQRKEILDKKNALYNALSQEAKDFLTKERSLNKKGNQNQGANGYGKKGKKRQNNNSESDTGQ